MEPHLAAVASTAPEDGQASAASSATPFTSSSTAVQLSNSFSKSGRRLTGSVVPYETPLPWLQGTWRGKGKGIYPTIKPFEYHEELSIQGNPSNPRPVLSYRQRTWSKHANPKPMHEEQGWIRVLPPSDQEDKGCQRVEVVGAAQNGTCTIEEGFVREHYTLVLRSTSMARSSTSRNPYAVEFTRTFEVDVTSDPPTMHYTMDMCTTTTLDMTRHLEAWLVKLHEVSVSPSPTMLYATPSGAASPVSIAHHQPGAATGASVLRSESSAGLLPPAGASLQHLLSSSPAALHAPHHLAHAVGLPPRPSSNLGLSTTQSNGTVVPLSPSLSSSGASLAPPQQHQYQHPHAGAPAGVAASGSSTAAYSVTYSTSSGHAAVAAASVPSTPPPVAPVLAGMMMQHDPLPLPLPLASAHHASTAAASAAVRYAKGPAPHHLAASSSSHHGLGVSGALTPSSNAGTPLLGASGALGTAAGVADVRANGAGPHPASLDLALRGLMLQAQSSPAPSGSVSRENLMAQGAEVAGAADEVQQMPPGLRAASPAVAGSGVCARSRLAAGAIAAACPHLAAAAAATIIMVSGEAPPAAGAESLEEAADVRVCPAFSH